MRHVDIVLSDVSQSQCASLAESTQEISVLWGTSTSPKLLYTKVLVGHESIQSLHISQQVETEQDRIGKTLIRDRT